MQHVFSVPFCLRSVWLVFGFLGGSVLAHAELAFVDSFQPFHDQELHAGRQADLALDESWVGEASIPLFAEIRFNLDADSTEARAFGNHVMAQVQRNMGARVRIQTPDFTLDPLRLTQRTSDSDQGIASASTSARGLKVQGDLAYHNGQMIEMMVVITGLSADDSRRENLSLRLDISDWQRAGNYLSNTLYSRLIGRPGHFQSQVAFVAQIPGPQGLMRRLARVDQAGGGLRFVKGAGNQVAFPTFLSNRFEIAFLDQSQGRNRLMHYNILTMRLTYMMTLPDLLGAPALARGGRLVAFAAAESSLEDGQGRVAADIYVSDVEMGTIKAIDIPGSVDAYPQFSPDLKVLVFISSQPTWSELVLSAVPYTMVTRDRTKQGGERDPMDGLGADVRSIYGSPNSLHQPVWSPDGRHLVFIERIEGQSTLMHHDVTTGRTQAVAAAPLLADPVWSPDGREVLLVSGEALMRLNLAEQTMAHFPTAFPVTSPTWSRNGSGGSLVEMRGEAKR